VKYTGRHPPITRLLAFSHKCLRPHACNDGWVTLGQIAIDPETGEESAEYAFYLCRKCLERS
jgi:ribosomal protein S14